MVKKWKVHKWYECTILGEACQAGSIGEKPLEDCADCPDYQEWKAERKRKRQEG